MRHRRGRASHRQSAKADVVLLDINLIAAGGAFLNLAWEQGFSGKVLVVTAGVSKIEAARLMERDARNHTETRASAVVARSALGVDAETDESPRASLPIWLNTILGRGEREVLRHANGRFCAGFLVTEYEMAHDLKFPNR
jgi:hypothetical protein